MSLTKPYPPLPIDYTQWNIAVDMMAGGIGRLNWPSFTINKNDAGKYECISGKTGKIYAGPLSSLKDLTNAFVAPGQIIIFKGGESGMVDFLVEDTLKFPKGVFLKSAPGVARLKAADNLNKDILVIEDTTGDQYDYVWVDGLHVEGNRANQTTGKGLVLKNITHSWFTNSWFRDCKDGLLHAENTSGGNLFFNNWLLGTNGTCALLEGHDDAFSFNWLAYADDYGLRLNGNRAKVFGNHLWETVIAAIYLPSNLHILCFNTIEKIPGYGIEIGGHTNIVGHNPICVEGGKAPTIGIKLDPTWAKWNSISINTIVGATEHAIWIGEGADDNEILGNIMRACAAYITDLGLNNEKAHNKEIP